MTHDHYGDPDVYRPSRAEAEDDATELLANRYPTWCTIRLLGVSVDGEITDPDLDVEITSRPIPATRTDPGEPWGWGAVTDSETGEGVDVYALGLADELGDAVTARMEGWW